MLHTTREITCTDAGFSWTCGDCGTINEQVYAKWDDVIFGYQIHQTEARITDIENRLAPITEALAALNAETATTRATVSGASTTGRKSTP